MTLNTFLSVALLVSAALGHAFMRSEDHESTRYPILVGAELPLYPPLARHVHVTGNVEIKVAVEWGLLADTEVKSVKVSSRNSSPLSSEDKKELGRYLSEPSLTNLKTWRFHPEPRREFIAVYEYRIEGEPSEDPENPRVEFTFPVVKITAT